MSLKPQGKEDPNKRRSKKVVVILAFWFGPATAVKFGPLGRHWLGFMDGATEA
jgi:hypothetical protein